MENHASCLCRKQWKEIQFYFPNEKATKQSIKSMNQQRKVFFHLMVLFVSFLHKLKEKDTFLLVSSKLLLLILKFDIDWMIGLPRECQTQI